MHLLSALPTLLIVTALALVGVAIGPKAGPAKGRMWTGLTILIVGQLLSLLWIFAPMLLATADSFTVLTVLSGFYAVLSGIVFVTGVVVLASAIPLAQRSGFGYLDPSRPGAAPGYGTSYPAPAPDGSPYTGQPRGDVPPR